MFQVKKSKIIYNTDALDIGDYKVYISRKNNLNLKTEQKMRRVTKDNGNYLEKLKQNINA